MEETRGTFESEWPGLSRYAHNLLGSKGIYGPLREDILQDTAIKLFQMWDRVDRSRPLNGLVATIALNALRDEKRRAKNREVLGDVPEKVVDNDVEHTGMARVELQRVGRALTKLSPDHRLVLLHEVQEDEAPAVRGQAAMKMLRMRARRRLTTILEASAVVAAAFVARARRVTGAESAAALTAAVIAAGLPFAGVTAPEGPSLQTSRPPRLAAARVQDDHGERARSARLGRTVAGSEHDAEPVVVPSASGTADGRAVDPVTVPLGNGEVRASGEIKVYDVSVAVGQNSGPVPVCVSGIPALPYPVNCSRGAAPPR